MFDLVFFQLERFFRLMPLLMVLAVAASLLTVYHLDRQRRRRKAEGLQRLLDRDPSLRPTLDPCGVGADPLSGTAATPRGDRNFGLRYGVTGPIGISIDGAMTTLECAAFQWWYEDRRTNSGQGRSTTYVELTNVVAGVRLPAGSYHDVSITPESLFGRVGLTRGGQQLESSEFNRRFRVDAVDRTLAVHLLDARMQRRLLEEFDGRTIHLRGGLLLLGGTPSHRDTSLPGVIGELPAVRQDLHRLLEVVPPPFWRTLFAEREG